LFLEEGQAMTDLHAERRLPWVALALSFLSMGVGHIYCGRVARGLTLYVAWFAVPVLGLLAAVLPVSAVTLAACILAPPIAILAIYLYAAVDAYRTAKRTGSDYKLQDYNRARIYWMLILVQLACPVALTAGARELVFEAFYIPARSMTPSILYGDRVLVNKLIARDRFPERGDLVVFKPRSEDGVAFIKRVVALAGDTIVIDGEGVEINGARLQRDRIPPEALRAIGDQLAGDVYYEFNAGRRYKVAYGDSGGDGNPRRDRQEFKVPDDSVFVLGDNRDQSRDSRQLGAIHVGDIVGYVQYVYLPVESWTRFGPCRDEA
jgi:signal peptidase I